MDKFLNFLINHNTTIIEVLFGITLLTISVLAFRYFLFGSDSEGGGGNVDLSALEKSLKEIIEKAGAVGTLGASAGGDSQRLVEEINTLKSELETKKKEIEDAKASSGQNAGAGPGISNEEKSALEAKLKELEAKLAEYEIISEDIADLSFYKEQNIKLQKELEGLKAGGAPANSSKSEAPAKETAREEPVASAPAMPVSSAPKPEPTIQEPKSRSAEIPAEVAPSVPPLAPAPVAAVPPPVEETSASVDDDLMAEFAAAVAKQKTGGDEPAAPPVASAPTPAQAPVPNVASETKSQTAAENQPDAAPETESGLDLGQVDMDKMLAESAQIQEVAAEVSVEQALGSGMDENKLLQEAAAMSSVSAEDKKLMGDFENFVKKG